MNQLDLIRLIGDQLTNLDVLCVEVDSGSDEYRLLKEARERLDALQLQLVRTAIQHNTLQFRNLTERLESVNADLQQTITDLNGIAETLDAMTAFMGLVEQIVELIPA